MLALANTNAHFLLRLPILTNTMLSLTNTNARSSPTVTLADTNAHSPLILTLASVNTNAHFLLLTLSTNTNTHFLLMSRSPQILTLANTNARYTNAYFPLFWSY